jgi:hypothetical protein
MIQPREKRFMLRDEVISFARDRAGNTQSEGANPQQY